MFGPRWKPVMTTEEMAQQEDEERHPNILKNNLDETAMTEDGVNVNNDLTTVTWTSDEKEELKKEEEAKDEKIIKDEKETEKKEEPEEEKKEEAKEEDPLKKDED